MSEQDTLSVMDETPPPDIVARPARSSSAYKLCMQCGQNVLRPHYRAGSSICKRCERLEQGLPAPAVEEEAFSMPEEPLEPPEVVAERASALALEAPAPLPEAEIPPPLPPGAWGPLTSVPMTGSVEACQYLEATCGTRGEAWVTLDQIATKLREVLTQQVAMIGRVTRYGVTASREVRPEEVPLEVAAQALWLACDPLVQERLTAAVEMLRLNLNQVILGNLAYHDQDLLDQDPSLVPQASYAVQFGTGVGLGAGVGSRRPGSGGLPGRTGLPGGRLVDAAGQLVKDCRCCGREFHPQPQRPNPDYCDDGCGTFADQLRIWATNTVNDEVAGRAPSGAPLPDPRAFWPLERCQEPYLTQGLAFRETHVRERLRLAHEQQEKMRGL